MRIYFVQSIFSTLAVSLLMCSLTSSRSLVAQEPSPTGTEEAAFDGPMMELQAANHFLLVGQTDPPPTVAARTLRFRYTWGSMKPTPVEDMGDGYGGMGGPGMGMGGPGMAGYGAEYSAGGFGGMGGYGSEDMAGYGDMGGMGMGMESSGGGLGGSGGMSEGLMLTAFVLPKQSDEALARVEVVTPTSKHVNGTRVFQKFTDFQSGKKADPNLVAELKIVSDTIRQQIWKADLIRVLKKRSPNSEQERLSTEETLKQVLSQSYDTQLARQTLEVERLEQQLSQLRAEISRRSAAKERVVDVLHGQIVLESQGLLNE